MKLKINICVVSKNYASVCDVHRYGNDILALFLNKKGDIRRSLIYRKRKIQISPITEAFPIWGCHIIDQIFLDNHSTS